VDPLKEKEERGDEKQGKEVGEDDNEDVDDKEEHGDDGDRREAEGKEAEEGGERRGGEGEADRGEGRANQAKGTFVPFCPHQPLYHVHKKLGGDPHCHHGVGDHHWVEGDVEYWQHTKYSQLYHYGAQHADQAQ